MVIGDYENRSYTLQNLSEKILHSKQTSQLSRNSNFVMRLTWALGQTKLILKTPLDWRMSPLTITDMILRLKKS